MFGRAPEGERPPTSAHPPTSVKPQVRWHRKPGGGGGFRTVSDSVATIFFPRPSAAARSAPALASDGISSEYSGRLGLCVAVSECQQTETSILSTGRCVPSDGSQCRGVSSRSEGSKSSGRRSRRQGTHPGLGSLNSSWLLIRGRDLGAPPSCAELICTERATCQELTASVAETKCDRASAN